MDDRCVRLVRGWTAAVFATSAAALSHALGGGNAPHPSLVIFSLAVSVLVCISLAGRELSFRNLVAAVVISEGLFHLTFSLPSIDSVSPDVTAWHQGLMSASVMSPTHASTMAHMAAHDGTMWFSHAAAAALTIIFLRHGEISAVQLLHTMGMKATMIMGLVIVPVAVPSRIDAAPNFGLLTLAALDVPRPVRHRRGPPVLAS